MPQQAAIAVHAYDSDANLDGRTDDEQEHQEPPQSKAQSRTSKIRSFRIRTVSTFVLIGSFLGFIWSGHVPLMLMIFCIQFAMVRELFRLAQKAQQEYAIEAEQRQGRRGLRKAKLGSSQQWYFFGVAAFWMYLRFVKNQLVVEITSSAKLAHLLGWVMRRHSLLAYSLYTAGFVTFVLRLQKRMYMYQFGQYAWTHMILLVVFIPSSFFVSNIFDGLMWFLLPCSLVIINDIGAYLFGMCFGHRKLIQLSPKKTWEGFIGGCITTVVASWYLAGFMSRFKWMTCPRTDLSVYSWLDCEPDDLYKQTRYSLYEVEDAFPQPIPDYLDYWRQNGLGMQHISPWLTSIGQFSFTARPMQFHAVVLAAFASIIAPFGGFFASGFKRGFKIKDFGDSIPGHGGMTDRMDCQIVMATFSYLYFNNYVARETLAVGGVLTSMLQLGPDEQLELFSKLANILAGDELLPEEFVHDITETIKARADALSSRSCNASL